MIRNIYKRIIVFLLMGLFILSGCTDDSVSILKSSEQDTEELKKVDSEETEEELKKADSEETEEELKKAGSEETEEELEKASSEKIEESEEIEQDSEAKGESGLVFVDVCGAVKVPGVYQLPVGSRVFQAVEMAGGFREDAEKYLINQADILSDGQQIRILTKEEAKSMEIQELPQGEDSRKNASTGDDRASDKININRADKTVLMTIPGIGESKAEAIIAYREIHGSFSSVDELMQVEGIKEKTYEKLKDKITVD